MGNIPARSCWMMMGSSCSSTNWRKLFFVAEQGIEVQEINAGGGRHQVSPLTFYRTCVTPRQQRPTAICANAMDGRPARELYSRRQRVISLVAFRRLSLRNTRTPDEELFRRHCSEHGGSGITYLR